MKVFLIQSFHHYVTQWNYLWRVQTFCHLYWSPKIVQCLVFLIILSSFLSKLTNHFPKIRMWCYFIDLFLIMFVYNFATRNARLPHSWVVDNDPRMRQVFETTPQMFSIASDTAMAYLLKEFAILDSYPVFSRIAQ